MNPDTTSGEFLFDYDIRFTGVTEFGVSLPALLGGQAQPHAAGTRFDVAIDGTVEGPKLSGTIKGVDYLEMRADGRLEFNIRAVISTRDEQNIAFHATGLAKADGQGIRVVQTSTLKTASPAYAWVNQVICRGVGSVDLPKGEVKAKVYLA